MGELVEVFDRNLQFAGILDDADAVSYDLVLNELSTASLALPQPSEHNKLLGAHSFVRVHDEGRMVGVFRVSGIPSSDDLSVTGWTQYDFDHAIITLNDSLIFGDHEIGGEGYSRRQVMEYILGFQKDRFWTLGDCDFEDYFQYCFQNQKILPALWSTFETLTEDYTVEYDFATTPWTLHLRRAKAGDVCGLEYGGGLTGIVRTRDDASMITRLYPLGYGEGVNQLRIGSVNGGKDYIDADTQGLWGVVEDTYTDARQVDAATLKAIGERVLERVKNPIFGYEAAAVDMYLMTGMSWDDVWPGRYAHVIDREYGAVIAGRVKRRGKTNLLGSPGDVCYEIGNSAGDAISSLSDIAERLGVADLYSQGATNLYSQQSQDNADPTHPMRMRFYLPQNVKRINQVLLSIAKEPFRAYETGAESGGGDIATTEEGGGMRTSEAGDELRTSTPIKIITTEGYTSSPLVDGEVSTHTVMAVGLRTDATNAQTGNPIDANGGAVTTTGAGGTARTDATNAQTGNPSTTASGGSSPGTDEEGGHSHTVIGHSHSFSGSGSEGIGHNHALVGSSSNTGGISSGVKTVSISISGTSGSSSPGTNTRGAHSHTVNNHSHDITHTHYANHSHTISTHTHGMVHMHYANHSHKIPDHQHEFNHMNNVSMKFKIPEMLVEIPPHRHTVNTAHAHTVTLKNHAHDIVYGIFEGATASKYSVVVDGVVVPEADMSKGEIDVVRYLSANEEGKVLRGAWHEVQIVPDRLTRLTVNLFLQVFIQSRGGGDY